MSSLKRKSVMRTVVTALVVLLGAGSAAGQDWWPPKPLPGYNIFSDQQESWLGEVIAEEMGLDSRVVNDPKVNAYLQALGERLARKSKRPELRYQFLLVESSGPDAIALPGGRIYVTRGMLQFCQNEAELAAVLSHEIAHVALRQGAKTISRWLFWNIGVDTVSDKEDIRRKIQALQAYFGETDHLQQAADQLFGILRADEMWADKYGIWNLHAAGYEPSLVISFLRRFDAVEREAQGLDYTWLRLLNFLFGTHLPMADRANLLQLEIPWTIPNARAVMDTEDFRSIKAHLAATPSQALALPQ